VNGCGNHESEKPNFSQSSEKPAVVELNWATAADLDLEIWTDTGVYITAAVDWGPASDDSIQSVGCETFSFRRYGSGEDLRGAIGADFTKGDYVVGVTAWQLDEPPCFATVRLQDGSGRVRQCEREFLTTERETWFVAKYSGITREFAVLDEVVTVEFPD